MLCDEPQIRHELMKDGYMLGQYADSMQELARGMTKEERSRYKQEGLYEKLLDLQKECDPILMDGLPALYRIFDGGEDDDEEEEEEEQREDEDEDCDPDATEEAYSHCDDEGEDEEPYPEDKEANGSVVPGMPDHSSPAFQQYQQEAQPSNTHRTKVFSIGELS